MDCWREPVMTTGTSGADWRRILVPPFILLAFVAGLVFAWYSAHSLLMLFAGILFAVFLDACTRGLAYILPLPRRLAIRPGGAGAGVAGGAGDRLGRRPPARPGAHAAAGDGQPARRPRSLSCDLRHRPVRPGRPARPVAIHRRSWPPVRPCPVCGERRLCLRHHDHRHRLPRPVLRRPAGGLPRGRADPRAARAPGRVCARS